MGGSRGDTVVGTHVIAARAGADPLQTVELAFSADRNALFTAWNPLFTAWNALANLADLAGKVRVTVRANSERGFDPVKLENGVLEPLRETKLID